MSDINSMPHDTAVILQPCGHNPTGVDPTEQEWDVIIDLFQRNTHLIPIIDMAYYGFASGCLKKDS